VYFFNILNIQRNVLYMMVHALQQSLVVYLESLKIFQYKYVDIMYLCTYVTNPIYLIV